MRLHIRQQILSIPFFFQSLRIQINKSLPFNSYPSIYKGKTLSTMHSLNKQTPKILDMNPSTFLSLSSFLIFFAFSAHSAPDPVLDIAGKPLLTGIDYNILPVFRGRGGGLTLSTTNATQTCPSHVVQAQNELEQGLPLTFSPVNVKKGIIRVSTDQNIKFSAATTCVKSTVWKLAYDESTAKYFVTIGGVEGKPGPQTLDNWFKIEKYESDYKLLFCPTVCNFCKVICRDFGIFIDDQGRRRLALTLSDNLTPFRAMFRKA